ncbi:MAG TPA: hypothetical protein DCP63_12010 [Bacteroidetes bacterium]|nr:hypothetical protein [Bacteroidota bacterium]
MTNDATHLLRSSRPLFLFLALMNLQLNAQDKTDSPIYKGYRPPSPSTMIKRSDVSYNLVQMFILERKANAGEAAAQHELGLRYLLGEGTKADTAKGAFWIGKAAAQRHTEARYNLGILLFNGWGIDWNPFGAYVHFRACAQEDMPEAQHILGMFLTENLVVQRNWSEAYHWVKKSSDAGYSPAKEALVELEARKLGTESGEKQDSSSQKKKRIAVKQTLGFVFQDSEPDTSVQNDRTLLKDALREASPGLRKALGITKPGEKIDLDSIGLNALRDAAEEGSPEALSILARTYERGIGVQKDLVTATMYYIRAIRMSSPRSPALLARMIEGPGYLEELKSRVERNDPDALFAWAALTALRLDYFLAKQQFPITEKQALEFLNKAVAVNHIQAHMELGLCYYAGRWVEEDRAKAIELWRRAAAMGNKEARVRLAALRIRSTAPASAIRSAIDTLELAAQGGSVLAQVALGYCSETGTGVHKSASQAAHLYRGAAQRGSQDALFALKRMHDAIRPPEKEFQISEFEQ